MRSDEGIAFFEQLMDVVQQHSTLRREFADYQCNARPGDLKKYVPKFYDQLVLTGLWSEGELMAAVVGVVCQRQGMRLKTLTCARDDMNLQRPNPKFAKKKKNNNSPGYKRWQERQRVNTTKETI